MNIDTRVGWLKTGSLITIGFGVLIAAAAIPALSAPATLLLDLVFFPVDGMQTMDAPGTRLVAAIGGGVMFGWGMMLWLIATRVYPADPALGRALIVTGAVSWFVLDSLMSIAAGAPLNAFLNIGFLLVFLVPVWSAPAVGARHARD